MLTPLGFPDPYGDLAVRPGEFIQIATPIFSPPAQNAWSGSSAGSATTLTGAANVENTHTITPPANSRILVRAISARLSENSVGNSLANTTVNGRVEVGDRVLTQVNMLASDVTNGIMPKLWLVWDLASPIELEAGEQIVLRIGYNNGQASTTYSYAHNFFASGEQIA